ncbi:hypothetical protein [Streptomyces mobaraensis]|uniref:Uncharacterized protein n=1 Tax=Streptomyces mobaraensis TaxID=35621 RepID=A0A5N5W154_STRMB|nr:hypothetical protein [Streptomyces mobaraensis]KAB7835526.1 hypothetical protein FRZ00_26925 [Streptomyces mobaraensis]
MKKTTLKPPLGCRTPVPAVPDTNDDDWYGTVQQMFPSWVPLDRVRSVAAGEHWQAVRTSLLLGERALGCLGKSIGPVIRAPYTAHMVFLLGLNSLSSSSWKVPGARLLPGGARVEIPPGTIRSGRDVHWAVPPDQGRTDPSALRAALNGQPAATTPPPRGKGR